MKTITKTIPVNTKIYSTLGRCCRYQSRLPGGVAPVFGADTKDLIGFASLPDQHGGFYIFWVK